MRDWVIRRYAGTLQDVRGILAVERKTFNECPYEPEELQERFRDPAQAIWLAESTGAVVGFVEGIRIAGVQGLRLEADLLAVDPAWQRRGVATALLNALRAHAGDALALRGVVRPENHGANGAFTRAGFTVSDETRDLMLYRIRGWVPRPLPPWPGTVRPLAGPEEAAQLVALAPEAFPSAERIWPAAQNPRVTLLVATTPDGPAGLAELLEVHEMMYSGYWLETLVAPDGLPGTDRALIAAAVEVAKERHLDEVGILVPQKRRPLRRSLQAEGFVPLDSYRLWTAPPAPPRDGS